MLAEQKLAFCAPLISVYLLIAV